MPFWDSAKPPNDPITNTYESGIGSLKTSSEFPHYLSLVFKDIPRLQAPCRRVRQNDGEFVSKNIFRLLAWNPDFYADEEAKLHADNEAS
jgi:hypothetical protein